MSHPFRMDFEAKARELMTFALGVGISTNQSRELVRIELENICRDYACRAAGIAGNDPEKIDPSVWYKQDGWDHGGFAITWKEYAQELKKRLEVTEKGLEKIGISICRDPNCHAAKIAADTLEESAELNYSR